MTAHNRDLPSGIYLAKIAIKIKSTQRGVKTTETKYDYGFNGSNKRKIRQSREGPA